MAFQIKNLSVVEYANRFTFWHYRTTDTPATVDTAGYFTGDAVNMLRVGDVILVQQVDNVDTPTSLTASGFHNVLSNDGTTVDVSNATAIAVTDTD